jgi:hypothetical protein
VGDVRPASTAESAPREKPASSAATHKDRRFAAATSRRRRPNVRPSGLGRSLLGTPRAFPTGACHEFATKNCRRTGRGRLPGRSTVGSRQ